MSVTKTRFKVANDISVYPPVFITEITGFARECVSARGELSSGGKSLLYIRSGTQLRAEALATLRAIVRRPKAARLMVPADSHNLLYNPCLSE
jgi:hypothetical protein